MPNFSDIIQHFVKKKPSMFTFMFRMFLFFTHEKSKALKFLVNNIKAFDVLGSYFLELQSLYVLIWPCSYKKKELLVNKNVNAAKITHTQFKIRIFSDKEFFIENTHIKIHFW